MQISYDPSDIFGSFSSGSGFVGYLFFVIGLWPTLAKAGIPGWGALIPIYNIYLVFKLGRVWGVWMVLLLVPFANIFVLLWVAFNVSRAFGHGFLMAFFGLFLFAPIGFLVIGYGSSTYRLARFDEVNTGGEPSVGNNGA